VATLHRYGTLTNSAPWFETPPAPLPHPLIIIIPGPPPPHPRGAWPTTATLLHSLCDLLSLKLSASGQAGQLLAQRSRSTDAQCSCPPPHLLLPSRDICTAISSDPPATKLEILETRPYPRLTPRNIFCGHQQVCSFNVKRRSR
jgi:hypothetical protein